MLEMISIKSPQLDNNTYILKNTDKNEAVVIDPSFNITDILECLANYSSVVCLLTHGHYDHIVGLKDLALNIKDFKVYISQEDAVFLREPEYNLSLSFDISYSYLEENVHILKKNEVIHLLGEEIQCLFTPGHTPGGISFYFPSQKKVFAGDTLFHRSVGRTDLPLSNSDELQNSIKNVLFHLPFDTLVYPGHGSQTIIEEEIKNNLFVN